MSPTHIRFALYVGFMLGVLPKAVAQPVINEIMFHPAGDPAENPLREWVELYQPGPDAVDLSGWQLKRGITFTFPAGTIMEPGTFLVVAADEETFRATHPRFEHPLVAGWMGRLSNADEAIELETGEGAGVERLDYATHGDWALRVKAEEDNGFAGWTWLNQADGGGHTYERSRPDFAVNSGQIWQVSLRRGGTPGEVNGVFAQDIAPVILDLAHSPKIPRSTDKITISARVLDDLGASPSVQLFYRLYDLESARDWEAIELSRAGEDHRFIAEVGPFPDATIVEYYILASDGSNERTWPAKSQILGSESMFDPAVFGQANNALLQVDDTYEPGARTPGSPPRYRLIMTPPERQRLEQAQDQSSGREPVNAQFHTTFVSVDGSGVKVRHNCAVRDRGYSSRWGNPVSFHIFIPTDARWNGRKSIQLNSRYPHSQALGAAMFQLARVATTEAVPVEVRVNGVDTADGDRVGYGRYVRAEPMNADWIARIFPHDTEGNLYRIDDHTRRGKELGYEGEDPGVYSQMYFKKTNEALNDYSDFIAMAKVLSQAPKEAYREKLDEVINVSQWLRFLAINSLIVNFEGGLSTGRADDFGMYRGMEDTRFVLLPHDFDTVMGLGNPRGNIRMDIFVYRDVEGMERMFSENTQTIREYYQVILGMLEEFFHPEGVNPIIDQLLSDWVPLSVIADVKDFVLQRRGSVLDQIPTTYHTSALLDGVEVVTEGVLETVSGLVTLEGTFHVGETQSILVNGIPASLSFGEVGNGPPGTWSLSFSPSGEDGLFRGLNRLRVEYFSGPEGRGALMRSDKVAIYYPGPETKVSGPLTPLPDRGHLQLITPSHIVPGLPFTVRLDRVLQGTDHIAAHAAKETVVLETVPPGLTLNPSEITLNQGTASALVTARFPGPGEQNALAGQEEVLIPSSDKWHVYNLPEVLTGDWKGRDFNDANWRTQNGPFGFPPSQAVPGFVAPHQPTTYFRKIVRLPPKHYVKALLRLRYDDAAIVWINGGKAVTTPGLNDGATETTRSSIDRPGIPADFEEFVISPSLFVEGENIIAVELHQSDAFHHENLFDEENNDLVFDLELIAWSREEEITEFDLTARGTDHVVESTRTLEVFGEPARTVDGRAFAEDTLPIWQGLILITEDLILPETHRLEIAQGTRILVAPGVTLTLRGNVDSLGTAEAPVLWSCQDPGRQWEGLRIESPMANFHHTHIVDAAVGITLGTGSFVFRHGLIHAHGEALGAHEPEALVHVSDAVLKSSQTAVSLFTKEAVLERVTIVAGDTALSGNPINARLQDSVIVAGQRGISTSGSLTLIGSVIRDASGTGVTSQGDVRLENSFIVDCAIAVDAVAGNFQGNHLTISGPLAFRIQDSAASVAIRSSILAANQLALGAVDLLEIRHSLIPELFPGGEGNLVGDPRFIDPTIQDYRLQADSPARGAAPPEAAHRDLGAIPYTDPLLGLGTTIRWQASNSPFHITQDASVPADYTLQIDPGVQVYVAHNAELMVNGNLKILGTEDQRVLFSHHPGATAQVDPLVPGKPGAPKWAGIRLIDSLSSENIIQYTDFENAQPLDNRGSVGIIRSECVIDHCTFSGTHYRMIYGQNCSITVQHCIFPDMFAEGEDPVALQLDNVAEHLKMVFPQPPDDRGFVGGFPVGGHLRIYHNHFYGNKGHNDVIDADSGRWGEGPVLDCRFNHFHGPVGDEHIDLGGDAYIASNTFERVRKDRFSSDRGYASAISAGDRGGADTVVVARNVFRNVDHAINCKADAGTIFEHNTCLDFHRDFHYSAAQFTQDVLCSAVNLFVPEDIGPTAGAGAYMGYNEFYGAEPNVLLDGPNRPGFPRLISWADRDRGDRPLRTSHIRFFHNLIDPLLIDDSLGERHPGGIDDERWGQGNVRGKPGSQYAAHGLPFGATIPEWAYIGGGPIHGSSRAEATFVIGGPGIFAYRWRLDDGDWSPPIPIAPGEFPRDGPIVRTATLELHELTGGDHRLEVLGQDFAGNWQPEGAATVRQWVVDPQWSDVVLNEIRAVGEDAVELLNRAERIDLSGWKLAENEDDPDAYLFPAETLLEPDSFLIVSQVTLNRDGDALYLINPNGNIVDEVRFGHQTAGYTLGRMGDTWVLTKDTLGAPNEAQPLGDVRSLRISEVLAAGNRLFRDDWIELHNPNTLPIAIAGIRLTDNPAGDPEAHLFSPHSYLAPEGYLKLVADGSQAPGHVNFAIDADGDRLALLTADGAPLDFVLLTPQTRDQSIAWTPDGLAHFPVFPTDGFTAARTEILRMRQLLDHLRVSELHYNSIDGSEHEFVELTNTGEAPLDLTGVRFTRGIRFTFPELTLDPGGLVLIVRNEAVFVQRYPEATLPIAGEYNGKLDNSGETLTLTLPRPFGAAILDFRYEPTARTGHSLELADLEGSHWQSSQFPHGSPAGEAGVDLASRDYAAWAASKDIHDPDADPDQDGWTSFLEYALGSDPRKKDASHALSASPNGKTMKLFLGNERSDVTYVIEASSNLRHWRAVVERPAGGGWPEWVALSDLPGGARQITVSLDEAHPHYLRLAVQLRPEF